MSSFTFHVSWNRSNLDLHLFFIEVFSVASRGTAELAARVSSQRGIGVLELNTGPTPCHWKKSWNLKIQKLRGWNPNPKKPWEISNGSTGEKPIFFCGFQLDDIFFTRNLPVFFGTMDAKLDRCTNGEARRIFDDIWWGFVIFCHEISQIFWTIIWYEAIAPHKLCITPVWSMNWLTNPPFCWIARSIRPVFGGTSALPGLLQIELWWMTLVFYFLLTKGKQKHIITSSDVTSFFASSIRCFDWWLHFGDLFKATWNFDMKHSVLVIRQSQHWTLVR